MADGLEHFCTAPVPRESYVRWLESSHQSASHKSIPRLQLSGPFIQLSRLKLSTHCCGTRRSPLLCPQISNLPTNFFSSRPRTQSLFGSQSRPCRRTWTPRRCTRSSPTGWLPPHDHLHLTAFRTQQPRLKPPKARLPRAFDVWKCLTLCSCFAANMFSSSRPLPQTCKPFSVVAHTAPCNSLCCSRWHLCAPPRSKQNLALLSHISNACATVPLLSIKCHAHKS